MKNILIINGHPVKDSYCKALAEEYKKGAEESGNQVELLNLIDLKFDLNLTGGFNSHTELEKDLQDAQKKILKANHIVIVHPVWWGSVPALLKGFFDRALLPGFAFKYRENSPMWDKLLSGRTGRIIYTADTPSFIYKYFFNAPSVNQVKKRTLQFCGINPVKVTAIAPIRKSTNEFREKNLRMVYELGKASA
jgi:NAD(P)H dehydrogenase (quinone)